ncbi:unnamed protein product [Miscanthus lutarioriparius]|uniref:Uncharacterized protein n=1 Tax=Miscanthus lutarioriparius TaxID=422564 RepID=A0A811RTG5_9POAL|nr:unnamed protein product [Miscanthus lutarioriparius]
MECRSLLETLLRTNAPLCVLALAICGMRGAHRRSIHFVPSLALPDEDDVRDLAPPPRRWYRAAYARLLRHAGSLAEFEHAVGLPLQGATGSLVACPHAAARAAHFDALAGLRRARRIGAAEEERAAHRLPAGDAAPRLAGRSRGGARRSPDRHGVAGQPFPGNPDGRADHVCLNPLPVGHGDVLVAVLDAPDAKVEAMKAGLYQIRDVVIERDIAFKEACRQDCLVQRKLSKSLGHSSRCLYTLLLFYFYGTVRDMEVHVGKCISGKGGRNVAIHAAKFLTDGDELMARSSVKQLSRALGVFRFVWEAVNTGCDSANHNGKDVVVKKKNEDARGVLELQRHLWSCGVEDKTVTYRGDVFHMHEIQLP